MYFPAASKGGGMAVGFPDVCKIPAPPAPFAPVPFPNIAQISGATGTVPKVKVCNKDIVVESSTVPSSKGDEAGTLKGLVKPMQMSKLKFLKGSSKVQAKGKKVVHHLAPTAQNGDNLPAGGVHVAPSQVKVLVHV